MLSLPVALAMILLLAPLGLMAFAAFSASEPRVALGVIATGATRVTDEMFLVAAKALANLVTEADLEKGLIYPPLTRIREVSAVIATAVAEVAYERGLARRPRPDDLLEMVEAEMYEPTYPTYA